jgi:hypothetical protein
MRWTFSLGKLLITFLVITLLPSLCVAQNQLPALSSRAVFEISTKSWDVYSVSECDQILNLRLYSDGRVEYEDCLKKFLDSGKPSYSIVRKETSVREKDIAALVRLIEGSGFPKAQGRMHSGLNLVDGGYTISLIYYADGGERKLEVVNYDPGSKLLPA